MRIFILFGMIGSLFGCGCSWFRADRFVASRSQSCATKEPFPPPTELVRWPYIQSATTDSVVVVWGTSSGVPATVSARGANGQAVANAKAEGEIPLDNRPLFLQSAKLEGLRPDTEYCYAIHAGPRKLIEGLSFRTAPAVTDASIRFLVIGDFGSGSPPQKLVRNRLAEEDAELLITTGDNAYSDGTHEEFQEHVFDVYRNVWGRMSVFPTPGNHDYRTEQAGPYLMNFVLPANAVHQEDLERYYSFDWGPVHFVAIDSEAPLRAAADTTNPNDAMLRWLEADLSHNKLPWTVAYFHRPPYTASRHGPNEDVQRILVPILEKYDVQIVFTGHNHVYERFHPLHGGQPAPDGTVFVTTGGGGKKSYGAGESPLLAATSDDYHYVAVEVDECALRGRAINGWGTEIDGFELRRCTPSQRR